VIGFLLLALASAEVHDEHAQVPNLEWELSQGWLEKFPQRHSGSTGVPLVLAFFSDPAFLGREVYVNFGALEGHSRMEIEVEWAFTRRTGLLVHGLWHETKLGEGQGDTDVGLRTMLGEFDRFLFTFTALAILPTGDEADNTGTGEWGWAGVINTWSDLGNWITLQTNLGVESHGDTEIIWSFSLAKSFEVPALLPARRGVGDTVPSLSLLAEVAGESGHHGTEGRWLIGVTYSTSASFIMRIGMDVAFDGDTGWIFGIVFHF
jgi:hypothetical protein